MTWKLKQKTFRWRFLESLEPAQVKHVEVFDLMQSDNDFAQITVRFFTKQASTVISLQTPLPPYMIVYVKLAHVP